VREKLMSRLTEGRKANILKMLSQLHAYLARYDDLDKAETHFQQRMEDAGCSDMYAVIDEVLDVVDTAKKSEKAKLLNKIYKTYFPKSAKAEPATDEEVESAMDTHHLDGAGEEAIEDEADESEASETDTDEDDVEDDEPEEDEDEGVTLGDVRKPEEDYVASAANGEGDDDEDDEKLDEGLYSLANRSRIIGDMKRSSVMTDEELEDLYNNAIRSEYKAVDPGITDELHRAVAAAKRGGAGEDEFFERTIKQARFCSKKIRESIEDDTENADSDDAEFNDRYGDSFSDDVELFNRDNAAGIEDDEFEDEGIDEDFDEFDPSLDSEEDLADFPVPAQAEMGNYPVRDNQSLQDAAEEMIADLIASGIEDDEDLIEAIIQEFSDPDHPMEYGMASDILEDYYEMNDPANEEATEGDMEQEYEDMAAEGFPDAEIIQKLSKKYGLTRHEIEMSIGSTPGADRSMPDTDSEIDEYPTVDDDEGVFEGGQENEMSSDDDFEINQEAMDELDDTEGENFSPPFLREGIDDEEGRDDISFFQKPVPRSSRAAHPEAMDVVKDVCEKLGCEPRFINPGASGYQVCLYKLRDDNNYVDANDVIELQQQLQSFGYPNLRAKLVGSPYNNKWLAFIVPYETKMFEAATITSDFNKAARAAYEQLAMGKPMNSVAMWLQDKYHFDQKQIDLIFHYMSMMKPKMTEGTMPGPSDQGGASTPPPHRGPSDSISAPTPDIVTDEPAPGTDAAKPQQGQSPDPKQMIQQNPDLAEFFAAMAKMKPEEIQNLTQMFTESLEDDEGRDVLDFEPPLFRPTEQEEDAPLCEVEEIAAKLVAKR
jgi:hypothetical protein